MSNTTTTRKPSFLAAELGRDPKGNPRAFHVEGYVSKPAYYREATGDKKSFLSTSIGLNMSAERMMALADGSYSKDVDYGENNGFLKLVLFGEEAEKFSQQYAVGVKVAVTGRLEWNDYVTKDNTPGRELQLFVDYFVVMGGKTKEPIIGNNIAAVTREFTDKDNVKRTTAYAALMSGKVVGCNGLKYSESGVPYFSFGVKTSMPASKIYALTNGLFNKEAEYDDNKRIVNVTLFNRSAEAMSKLVDNGAIVVCSGPVKEREYNGNLYYEMSARVCSIMKFAPKAEAATGESAAPAPENTASAAAAQYAPPSFDDFKELFDEDDGELPF